MSTAPADERWWHDLRNALGGISAALMVAKAELADDNAAIAQQFLNEAQAACDAAIALVRSLED